MDPLITLKEISLYFNQKKVFENLDLSIPSSSHIGLVGINGSGKTTLMKILAGKLEPDEGEVYKANSLKISYLPQDFDLPKSTIREFLFPDIHDETEKYLAYEDKLKKYLPKFSLVNLDRNMDFLSGGQQRQVLILKAVAEEPDLLLLDEPTNHLDLRTLENLKDLLRDYPRTFLIISHDRYFVDQVTQEIWELDQGKIFRHKGNYSDYLISKEERYNLEVKQYQKRDQELKRELEWVNSGVKARGTKDTGRLNRYYELKEYHKKHKPKWNRPYLPLPKMNPLGNKILKTIDLNINLPANSSSGSLVKSKEVLVKNLNLEFEEGMKLGLLGPNGSGKTTLIKTLLGEYEKESGKIIYGQNTEFNYQDQKRINLDYSKTLMYNISQNNLKMKFGETTMNVYAYLRKFMFSPDDLKKSVSNLSGGQKARLLLAKILKRSGNFLVLDEPTNDLDLDTLEALENSLRDFEGCLLIVSHDRFFMDRVCTHILAFEGDGYYTLSTGGYTDYLKKYGATSKYYSQFVEVIENHRNFSKDDFQDKPTNKLSPKEERKQRAEIRVIENKIKKLSEQILDLESKLADPKVYTQGQTKIKEIYTKIKNKKEQIEELEFEWLEIAS